MINKSVLLLIFYACFSSCSDSATVAALKKDKTESEISQSSASLGLVGDSSDIVTETLPGLVLMGGSTDVDPAIKWMLDRSGGGDVVIIRASGTDAYNQYMYNLGSVNSVETLKIDSRSLANDERTVKAIRDAEMLFIAGGDQSQYVRYWKGTKTMDAINYLLNEKKVPVGGTSAGSAILGNLYFTGENGSAVSSEVLSNPYDPTVRVFRDDFLQAPYLNNVITDQHFSQREREGRLVVFLARIFKDWDISASGIGVDEKTAICIDENGNATVFGTNKAYFLKTFPDKTPEVVAPGTPMEWNQQGKAILTYELPGSLSGNGNFNLEEMEESEASGGKFYWWFVENNTLNIKNYNP